MGQTTSCGEEEQAESQEGRDSRLGDDGDLARSRGEGVGVPGGGGESHGGVGARKGYLGGRPQGSVITRVEAQGEDDGIVRLGGSKNVGTSPLKSELAGGALIVEAGGAEPADVCRVGDSAKVNDGRVPYDGAHAGQNLEEVVEAEFHVHVIAECEIQALATCFQTLGERKGDRAKDNEDGENGAAYRIHGIGS